MYYIHLQSFFCVDMYIYMCLGVYLHVNGHIGPKISVRWGVFFHHSPDIYLSVCTHVLCHASEGQRAVGRSQFSFYHVGPGHSCCLKSTKSY